MAHEHRLEGREAPSDRDARASFSLREIAAFERMSLQQVRAWLQRGLLVEAERGRYRYVDAGAQHEVVAFVERRRARG